MHDSCRTVKRCRSICMGSLDPASIAAILDDVRHLPPDKQTVLIETGEHEGTPYIVTNEWPAALSFRAWVAGASVRQPSAPPSDRLMTAGTWRVPTSEFRGRAEMRTPPPAGTPEAKELESFTKMFSVPAPEQPPVPPKPEPQEPHAPEPPKHAPGEFTRMFATGVSPEQPRAPEQPPQQRPIPNQIPQQNNSHAGVRDAGRATPRSPVACRFETAWRIHTHVPGKGRSSRSRTRSSRPPSAATNQPGSFTQMFQAATPQGTAAVPAAAPPVIPPTPQQAPAATHQPGSFTQMFQAAPPQTTGAVPAASPAFPPQPPPPSSQPDHHSVVPSFAAIGDPAASTSRVERCRRVHKDVPDFPAAGAAISGSARRLLWRNVRRAEPAGQRHVPSPTARRASAALGTCIIK